MKPPPVPAEPLLTYVPSVPAASVIAVHDDWPFRRYSATRPLVLYASPPRPLPSVFVLSKTKIGIASDVVLAKSFRFIARSARSCQWSVAGCQEIRGRLS